MAILLKNTYINYIPQLAEPVLYIDSCNLDSYMAEMYNMTVKYIRENTESNDTTKREKHMAIDENDIYYNKLDGYWILGDAKNFTVTLYQKKTMNGVIYNSVQVDKIYRMECKKCPRIVPQFIKKPPSLYDNFLSELTSSVANFKERSDTVNVE